MIGVAFDDLFVGHAAEAPRSADMRTLRRQPYFQSSLLVLGDGFDEARSAPIHGATPQFHRHPPTHQSHRRRESLYA
jgi:hypothetical protein